METAERFAVPAQSKHPGLDERRGGSAGVEQADEAWLRQPRGAQLLVED
jgi:hypothetical protein